MNALTEPRKPAGPIRYRADAVTNEDLWKLAGNLEDWGELSEGDKERVRKFVDESTRAIEGARQPACTWYDIRCRLRKAAALKLLEATPARDREPTPEASRR